MKQKNKIHINQSYHSPKITGVAFYIGGMQVNLTHKDDNYYCLDGKSEGETQQYMYGEGSNLREMILDFKHNLLQFINTFSSSNCLPQGKNDFFLFEEDPHLYTCNVLMTQLKILLQQEGVLDEQFRPL